MTPEQAAALLVEVKGLRRDVQKETATRKIQNGVLFVLVALMAAVGLAVYVDHQANIDRVCDAVIDNRDLLDAVVTAAYAGDDLDLTAFPSAQQLSPEVLAWAAELSAFLNAGDTPPDAITALLAEVTC